MRKITLFIASLFLTIGAMAQVVADGVYTIQADENGKRGYLAASASHARPVLTEISWSDYAGNSCTDIVENGKLWCVKNVDGVAYICNLGNGMFIEDNGTDDILFGAPSAFNITQHNSYIHVGSGEGIRYLSMGCGATAPNQVKWEKGNANDGGCLLTFKAVEGDYSAQIAAVEKNLERSKKYVSYGVYTVSNKFNNRGTLAYGTYNGTEYFGLADITLSSYAGNSVAVENAANAVWYTVETEKGRYIYNVGKGLFLQNATQTNASCAAEVATGFTYEVRANGGNSYVSIKDGNYYLSCSCGWKPNQGQVRWLTSNEEAATLLTLTSVTPFAYADAMAAADAAIAEFEAPAPLAVVSQSPAADVQVESLSSITIEFNKAVKLDWEPSTSTGTDGTGTGGTGTSGTGTGGTGTGTDGDIQYINLKGANGSNVATVWLSNADYDGNKVTFNFSAVKTTGTYTFTIPADLIVAAEGDEKYAGGTFTFNVLAAPVYKSSTFGPKYNSTNCYALEDIKVTFSENIDIVGTEALELKNGEEVVAITDIEVGIDGKSMYLYLDEPLTKEVTTKYSLVIPAGYVVTKGTELGLANDVTVDNIKVVAPFEIKNITPANAAVIEEPLENIVIEFSKNLDAYNTNKLALRNEENDNEVALTASIDGNVLTLTPAVAVANGTYTLSMAGAAYSNGLATLVSTEGDGIVSVEGGEIKGAPVYTITINCVTTAIDSVNAQAESAEIYDLTGRRVEKITNAGIYVINGVKKVVK